MLEAFTLFIIYIILACSIKDENELSLFQPENRIHINHGTGSIQ